MPFLLSLSRRIDGFTEFIGRWVAWLVLAAVLISATNAVVRKAFNIGSNALPAAAHLRHHAERHLLAIPFFTFMGMILERSGMAEDLLDTIGQLFGPIRGGLAYAVIWWAPAGRHHRRGGRLGDLDGPDLAAHHAALRLQPAHATGRDCRLGHAGADHSALAGADHLADQLGRSVGDMYKGAFLPA
jgi:hypothetical protein